MVEVPMHAQPLTSDLTWQYLHRFVKNGCQTSFRTLFELHAGLVFSAALRTARGDRDIAEEVLQIVFVSLAQKASSFSRKIILPAWLHRHACLSAQQILRSRRRRCAREADSLRIHPEVAAVSPELAAVIDEALNSLSAHDREVLALRFFENRDFRTMGRELGVSDDTAQKRVSRGLERLRKALRRMGVQVSASAVGSFLSEASADAAQLNPAPIFKALLATKLNSASAVAAGAASTMLTMKTATIATASLAILVAAIAIPQLRKSKTGPASADLAEQKTSPIKKPVPAQSVKSRATVPQRKIGAVLPSQPAANPPATYPPELQQAFLNHPKTKIAEKRVNTLKSAGRTILEKLSALHRKSVADWQAFQNKANDSSLTETERTAARVDSEKSAMEVKGLEGDIEGFRQGWEAFLRDNVAESRKAILDELTNPQALPPPATEKGKEAARLAEQKFLDGDFAAAEQQDSTLAAHPSADIAAMARWRMLLSRMIQGADHSRQLQPLLQGSTSAACYALAAHSIDNGNWEVADVYIEKARQAGDAAENAGFDAALQSLGWLDSATGRLIPPDDASITAQKP